MKRKIKIILSWILIVAIPIATLGLSANIILRLPDLYQYQINKGELLKEYRASSQSEEVAALISEYMIHKVDELQYQTDEEDEMSLIFTKKDQEKAEAVRFFADVLGAITILSIVIITITYYLLIKEGHLAAIRSRFKLASVIFVALGILTLLCCHIPNLKEKIFESVFYGVEELDFVYKLLCCGTYSAFCVTTVMFSIVIMLLFTYFTWKKTKERGIFW